MAKRTFVYLRTQEIIILYWVAGGLVMMGGKLGTGADLFGGPFGVLIWDQYLIQSPQADGLAEHIPTWVVPPRGSEVLLERSFLDSAWLKPIVILLCAVALQRGQRPVVGLRALPHHPRHRAPALSHGVCTGRRCHRPRRDLGQAGGLALARVQYGGFYRGGVGRLLRGGANAVVGFF